MYSNKQFSELLLHTAFSCMACDGDIDSQEVALLRSMEEDRQLFNLPNLGDALNHMVEAINQQGHQFLKAYFQQLEDANLSEEQELSLIRVAIETIEADGRIEYSEVKFFKIIYSKLHTPRDVVLEKLSDIEQIDDYLAQDIVTESYLDKIMGDYFSTTELPTFGGIELE